jgi:hypothetical protein
MMQKYLFEWIMQKYFSMGYCNRAAQMKNAKTEAK